MPPPKPRERYNAKARQATAGSTHKKRKQVARRSEGADVGEAGENFDDAVGTSNAILIDPTKERERKEADAQRRALLAQQDSNAAEAPISSKKRKRLDAFIARQLKKEKRQQLIADLAKSSAEIGDRSALVTAATLGTGRAQTGQDRLDQEVAKDDRLAQRRRNPHLVINAGSESSESEGSEDEGPETAHTYGQMQEEAPQHDAEREERIARARSLFGGGAASSSSTQQEGSKSDSVSSAKQQVAARPPLGSALGSALALGPDGKPMIPVMKKKKKQVRKPAGRKTAWGRETNGHKNGREGSDEESDFDSSASSEMDSSGDEAAKPADNAMANSVPGSAIEGSDDDEDESSDGSSFSDEADDSEASDTETDEEEQAILEEAMRLRGMLGNPNVLPPTDADYAKSENADDNEESTDDNLPFTQFEDDASAEREEAEAMSADDVESDGEDEQDGSGDESDNNEGDDSEDDDDDEEDESTDEDDPDAHEIVSRRRGLPTTERSMGFKDWAKSALGLSQRESEPAAIDDEYRGPEPVAGLTHKVGEGWDGAIRGPLGEAEPGMNALSAFAQKHYEELKEREPSKSGAKAYHITRSEELQEARLRLPVVADEEKIVRTISENMVTVLCGETGSGKTTQVPQFLFEAGFGSPGSANPGMIGVTQPRRVAALSMAARVGYELGLGPHRVSHQIRYDANVSPSTSVKFMTDGVLLRELALDFLLEKYSAIIIDEAHERSVNTDVLIGVLSRIVQLRAKRWLSGTGRPLRLIIMSATLRVDDFAKNARLFSGNIPVLQVEARQYPVVTHFSRRTHHDYVEETIKKACKIHARLPSGGILIFLTGQAEIATVCKRLEARYGKRAVKQRVASKKRAQRARDRRNSDEESEVETTIEHKISLAAKDGDVETEELDLGTSRLDEEGELAMDVDDANGFDDEEALETDDEHVPEYDADLPAELRDDSDKPMHILPLYSLLPSDRQMEVFRPPPEGSRLVVVATNIAETSLTIPGISYVVDSGRSKERKYDAVNGVQSFEVGFISKASANQRAGRAGRTGPGHCYRLYSSNLYEEHMPTFAEPEILRTPVDNLVLMMKAMNIDNVANFPFPTPPDREALRRAEKLLVRLGALESSAPAHGAGQIVSASEYKITPLGRAMSLFPLSTRLSKLLVQGHQHGCLPLVVALVAALTVGDPFIREESLHDRLLGSADDTADLSEMTIEAQHMTGEDAIEAERRRAKRSAYYKSLNRFAAMSGALSDPLRLLSAVGAYEHEGGSLSFCEKSFLMPKVMEEIHKLRSQIANLVRANAAPGVDTTALRSPHLAPPTPQQLIVLRQFLLAAFVDQVAIRADLAPESAAHVPMLQNSADGTASTDGTVSRQFHHQQKLGAKMQSTRNVAYLAAGIPHEACFIHKSSVLFHQQPPEWIIFTEVMRSRAKGDRMEREGRNWLKGVSVVSPKWIYKLGPTLCSLSKPIEAESNDSRSRLVQAAQELKRRQQSGGDANPTAAPEKSVYLVPSYGTGPAVDVSERSSHVGWNLPPIAAKQRFIGGRWITEMP